LKAAHKNLLFACPLVLDAARVKENWFLLSFIMDSTCHTWRRGSTSSRCRACGGVRQPQPVQQRALGLLLAGRNVDHAASEMGRVVRRRCFTYDRANPGSEPLMTQMPFDKAHVAL
jgi:hypothetical protein